MLYILEGCDGSGKTTLAHQLSLLLDAEIIHSNSATPNDYEYFKTIADSAEGRNVIADRFCYGQFVYQEEEERPLGCYGKAALDTSLSCLYRLESKHLMGCAKVILVTAPNEIIRERLASRNEVLINGLTIEEVQAKFQRIKELSMLTWFEYDSAGGGLYV